ncbi:LuxE/PaaK family acyltransferase [Nocardia takedensis]
MTTVAGSYTESDLTLIGELDQAVFSEGSAFEMDSDAERDFRVRVIRSAVGDHLRGCEPYRRLAQRQGFDVATIVDEADLGAVPVLPTGLFKRTAITSAVGGDLCRTFLSSGTNGLVSSVPRDEPTLKRLLGGLRTGLRLLADVDAEDDVHTEDLRVLNLGPSRAEAGDVWFGYVMSLVEMLAETEHLVRGSRFELAEAASRLSALSRSGQRIYLVGPPPLVVAVAEYVAAHRVPVDGTSVLVVTGGGWKDRTGRRLDTGAFRELVTTVFGLPPGHVRDWFNQVELNSVLVECDHGRKHAPPWLYPVTRDERLRALPDGTPGLLSYLDPTATSYPCFIVGDDVGSVDGRRCACGRAGRLVDVHRRLDRPGSAGCAVRLDARYGGGRDAH